MAQIIYTDGTYKPIEPANGSDFTLEELYKIIGTNMVQVIPAGDGRIMVLDEDGKLKHKAENDLATAMVRGIIANDDFIVGIAVVCLEGEFK